MFKTAARAEPSTGRTEPAIASVDVELAQLQERSGAIADIAEALSATK